MTVLGNDSAVALESDDDMPGLDGTSESDPDPFGDDSLSAISGSEGDFDIDDLCGDHFGFLAAIPVMNWEGQLPVCRWTPLL